jgi:chloramphenicol 3-O-phosphotransferase
MQSLAAGHLILIFLDDKTFLFYCVDNQVVGQAKVGYAHIFQDEFLDPWLSININALFPALQGHSLQEPKQASAVIGMHVADKDLHFPVHAKAGLDEVALHPFSGVKEQELGSPHKGD